MRSYFRLTRVDLGYPADEIAQVMPFFDQSRYPTWELRQRFAEDLAARAATLPGVARVAVRGDYAGRRLTSSDKPLTDAERYDSRLIVDGDTARAIPYVRGQRLFAMTEDYFTLLGLGIRSGRGILPDDRPGGEPVVVVSAAAATKLWPTQPALGRTLQVGASRGARARVVGVVDDAYEITGGREGRHRAPVIGVYFAMRQSNAANPQILARGRGRDPTAARAAIVAELQRADRYMTVFPRMTTLASDLDSHLLATRVFGGLVGGFAVVALALSLIGIYGVVAFGVARRTREIGVRMALGGTTSDVLRLVMLDALTFVGIGIGIGLLLAAGLGRLIGAFLYGITSTDPITLAAVSGLFGSVALVACYLPARRATRVDPVSALRAE